MILVKVLEHFLIPSVFLWLLAIGGLILYFAVKKCRKVGVYLIIFSTIFYYLFSISPIADLILWPLEKKYTRLIVDDIKSVLPVANIVLLTGGGESNILRLTEVLRIYVTKKKMREENLTILISGDDLSKFRGEGEAEAAKNFLIKSGVPSRYIILDGESRNTFKSAREIKNILGEENFYLVTSAYHLPRAVEVLERMGANPIAAPADFKINGDYDLFSFFPSSGNLSKCDLAIHEYLGIIFYKLKLLYGNTTI